MIAIIPLDIETTEGLHERAVKAFLSTGAGSPEDVERTLGTPDSPNVGNCVRELYWADDHHDFTTLNEGVIVMDDQLFQSIRPTLTGEDHDEIA